jgi:ABC-type tungstate transport system substrate-binding protein
MSWQEARSRFSMPYHFELLYKGWQKKYSDDIVLTLPLMSAKDRTNNQELEKRIKELEKELELAQMKIVALNTVIDIAEKDYKLEIRKKSGPKQ